MTEREPFGTERFRRLSALLDQALALPPNERARFVGGCEPEDLRPELAALLALEDETGPLDRSPRSLAGEALRDRRLGRYRLLEPLGEGGMATVWRAEHNEPGFSRRVAVKCLKTGLATPELRARFLREQQILAGLEHPNVARLYDAGISDEGVPFIVMELIDGVPVTEHCDRHKLSIRARLKLFRQVLDAVACAHQSLIVHRDLKPANILVTQDGRPRLLDFGIAKALDEQDEATRTQMRALTPGYAAPEQFRGHAVTTATDVYALGVILHELLTGIRPIRDTEVDPVTAPDPPLASRAVTGEPDAVARRRGMGDSRRLSQALEGDLDTLIAVALRPDPAKRYRDAAALDAEIERYLLKLPLKARRASRAYSAAKFLRRNWLPTAAAAGIAAALVIGAGVALWQAGQARFEAERATAALDDTEQALRRAEALQEFLLDLFRSAQPDRPRDQLPTTEEILALGAERAMDEDAAPPGERVVMLMTIGDIYRQQGWIEQARPLLEEAVLLARMHREQRPEDLALALWRNAILAMGERDFERSDTSLLEAESLVEDTPEFWSTFATIRAWRGWSQFMQGNHDENIRLSEPLYRQLPTHDRDELRLRYLLTNNLATSYKYFGNLEAAAALHAERVDVAGRLSGTESLSYAVQLGNGIDLEYFLGRFDSAESMARRAIELYDRIYQSGQPTAYRAMARFNLATTLMYSGRFDEALVEMDASNAERAQARGIPVADWAFNYLNRGGLLARMHRWEEAETDLLRARDLFHTPALDEHATMINLYALLAWTLCSRNKTVAAREALRELDAWMPHAQSGHILQQAQIHETRATCYLQSKQPDMALPEIESALALETHYPGRIIHQVDRRILRARILAGLGRQQEAAQELDLAEQVFLDLDLASHPHFPDIQVARAELAPDRH